MAGFSFPDRVTVTVAGQEIFPDGEITNLSIDENYNASLVDGFNKEFEASGDVLGNAHFGFSFTVNYTPESKSAKLNMNLLFNRTARPAVAISPFDPNHAMGDTVWTFTGVRLNGRPTSVNGVGQSITRTYNFIARTYSES